ncbi:unnamed protein product [Paramecium sonneborni]|uniref:Uncharacterized protein n=1 Tax=Paramecium sonneborni TaxID=65129 RepID=A0A8S1KC21_9CILI|nr:unnamed protein product [Paramecium sonneborni]
MVISILSNYKCQQPFYQIINGLDFKSHAKIQDRKISYSSVNKNFVSSQKNGWKFAQLYQGNEEVVLLHIKFISESLQKNIKSKELPKQQLLYEQFKLPFPKKRNGDKREEQIDNVKEEGMREVMENRGC